MATISRRDYEAEQEYLAASGDKRLREPMPWTCKPGCFRARRDRIAGAPEAKGEKLKASDARQAAIAARRRQA